MDPPSDNEFTAPKVGNILVPDPLAANGTELKANTMVAPPQPEVQHDGAMQLLSEATLPTNSDDSPSKNFSVKTTRSVRAVQKPSKYRDTN